MPEAGERFEIGKSGSVFIDDVELHVTGWSVSEESDWQETTHSGSGGYHSSIPGIKKLSGSFNASFNLDSKPVPSLEAGAIVKLKLEYEEGDPAVEIETAGIDSFEVTSEVKGVLKFSCKFHAVDEYEWET